MFSSFLRTALAKLVGLVLFLAGVWVGLVVYYGEEAWQQSTLVKYGGMILAWGLAGLGVSLMSYKSSRTKQPDEPS